MKMLILEIQRVANGYLLLHDTNRAQYTYVARSTSEVRDLVKEWLDKALRAE